MNDPKSKKCDFGGIGGGATRPATPEDVAVEATDDKADAEEEGKE